MQPQALDAVSLTALISLTHSNVRRTSKMTGSCQNAYDEVTEIISNVSAATDSLEAKLKQKPNPRVSEPGDLVRLLEFMKLEEKIDKMETSLVKIAAYESLPTVGPFVRVWNTFFNPLARAVSRLNLRNSEKLRMEIALDPRSKEISKRKQLMEKLLDLKLKAGVFLDVLGAGCPMGDHGQTAFVNYSGVADSLQSLKKQNPSRVSSGKDAGALMAKSTASIT